MWVSLTQFLQDLHNLHYTWYFLPWDTILGKNIIRSSRTHPHKYWTVRFLILRNRIFSYFGPTLSIILLIIDNLIQVHIPQRMSSRSFVFRMKCDVTSYTTHDVLISKEISYKSYKEICRWKKKKVNLGFNNDPLFMTVMNNTLMPDPPIGAYLHGERQRCPISLVDT